MRSDESYTRNHLPLTNGQFLFFKGVPGRRGRDLEVRVYLPMSRPFMVGLVKKLDQGNWQALCGGKHVGFHRTRKAAGLAVVNSARKAAGLSIDTALAVSKTLEAAR